MRLYIILGFVSCLFLGAYFIKDSVVDYIRQGVEIEVIKDKVETERRIDNAIQDTIQSNPDSDPSMALEWLRQRQADHQ